MRLVTSVSDCRILKYKKNYESVRKKAYSQWEVKAEVSKGSTSSEKKSKWSINQKSLNLVLLREMQI